jgi:hypothetical protein
VTRAPARFPAPVEGGFAFEVASRAVFGERCFVDEGPPSVGRGVAVILEWKGVDQLEVRGEIAHVVDADVVGARLEIGVTARGAVSARGAPRAFVGVLHRGDVDLARSTASRTLAVWRLALLVPADSVAFDEVPAVRETRLAIAAR